MSETNLIQQSFIDHIAWMQKWLGNPLDLRPTVEEMGQLTDDRYLGKAWMLGSSSEQTLPGEEVHPLEA